MSRYENPLFEPMSGMLAAADFLEEHGWQDQADEVRRSADTWLLRFCDGENPRLNLGEPFVRGGWTYATDSRIAIRMPSNRVDGNCRLTESVLGVMLGYFEKYHEAVKTGPFMRDGRNWRQWPSKPVEMPLDGMEYVACQICRGDGRIFDVDGDVWTCVYCDATGNVGLQPDVMLEGGTPIVGGRYWSLIRRLPDVWYIDPESDKEPIPFRFRFGQGLLMPIDEQQRRRARDMYIRQGAANS